MKTTPNQEVEFIVKEIPAVRSAGILFMRTVLHGMEVEFRLLIIQILKLATMLSIPIGVRLQPG